MRHSTHKTGHWTSKGMSWQLAGIYYRTEGGRGKDDLLQHRKGKGYIRKRERGAKGGKGEGRSVTA